MLHLSDGRLAHVTGFSIQLQDRFAFALIFFALADIELVLCRTSFTCFYFQIVLPLC